MNIDLSEYEEIPLGVHSLCIDAKHYRHKVTGCELTISCTPEYAKAHGAYPYIKMKQNDYPPPSSHS